MRRGCRSSRSAGRGCRGRRLGGGCGMRRVPLLEAGLRQGREELNGEREKAGLAPTERFHGGTSEGLALVATLPQLEYPRRWPEHVHVTGPMEFETPYEDVELPEGDGPLVLVAPSTAQDPECRLVRVALEALADEPVRVLATTNGHYAARGDRGAGERSAVWVAELLAGDGGGGPGGLPRRAWDGGAGAWRRRAGACAARRLGTWPRTARASAGRAWGWRCRGGCSGAGRCGWRSADSWRSGRSASARGRSRAGARRMTGLRGCGAGRGVRRSANRARAENSRGRTRTDNRRLNRALLRQLSYPGSRHRSVIRTVTPDQDRPSDSREGR